MAGAASFTFTPTAVASAIGALSGSAAISFGATGTLSSGATADVKVSWIAFDTAASPVDVKVSWIALDTAAAPVDVKVSWIAFDTAAEPCDVKVSWVCFDSAATSGFSQEVILNPRKYYLKRKKQILLFNSPEEADAFIESEAVAEKAIEQAQKTSRRARKRLRDKIITVTPEVVDTDYLSSLVDRFNIPVNLPSLIAQQDYDRVMQIMQLAMEMQDEEDVELLLLM